MKIKKESILQNFIKNIKTIFYNIRCGSVREGRLSIRNIIKIIKMAYDKNLRKGGKAEYLAQVYLTSLGFSNPTYRQEDFGIDFTCILTDEKKNKLYPTEPFNVQVKSHKKKKDQVLKFKKKNPQDLDWLFKNPNPYILAWVDYEKTKDIYFYSLSPIWYLDIAKVDYKGLEFRYDTDVVMGVENTNNYKPDSVVVNTHFINLGKPFMTMSLNDLKNDKKIKEKGEILKYIVKLEKENIQYRSFGVPFMKWLWKFKTDELDSFICGWSHFCNNEAHQEINEPKEIIKNIGHILITLASSFALNNQDEEDEKYEEYLKYHLSLIDLLKLLPLDENNYGDILRDLKYIDMNGNFIEKQLETDFNSLGPTGHNIHIPKMENIEIQQITEPSKQSKRMGDFKEPRNKRK